VTRRLLSSPEQDRDDVAGEVILDLTARLKSLKKERGAIIERFTAYAVVCAQNGCDRYLRLRHPERHRLKNRLRYLIGKSPEFRIWEHPGHGWGVRPHGMAGPAAEATAAGFDVPPGPTEPPASDSVRGGLSRIPRRRSTWTRWWGSAGSGGAFAIMRRIWN
jgi:hypothetical protein